MTDVSARDRREILKALLMLPWLACGSCARGNWIERERVCAHVFQPTDFVPDPLSKPARATAGERKASLLTVGPPELVVCTVTRPLVDLFPYFWPLAQTEIQALAASIDTVWAANLIQSDGEVQQLRQELGRLTPASGPEHIVVLFTMNDFTSCWAAAVVGACRDGRVDELVVFKDPTIPPYLCDYPALQRRFRRPPP